MCFLKRIVFSTLQLARHRIVSSTTNSKHFIEHTFVHRKSSSEFSLLMLMDKLGRCLLAVFGFRGRRWLAWLFLTTFFLTTNSSSAGSSMSSSEEREGLICSGNTTSSPSPLDLLFSFCFFVGFSFLCHADPSFVCLIQSLSAFFSFSE